MKINKLPPIEVLQQYLDYNSDTGELTWKVQHGRGRIGQTAGNINSTGYRMLQLHGKRLRAHRICWAMYHGHDVPDGMIVDHINGNRGDNRIENLRATSSLVNNYNVNNPRQNKSGVTGVHPADNRWLVQVGNDKIGRYDTFEEAVKAREAELAKRLETLM